MEGETVKRCEFFFIDKNTELAVPLDSIKEYALERYKRENRHYVYMFLVEKERKKVFFMGSQVAIPIDLEKNVLLAVTIDDSINEDIPNDLHSAYKKGQIELRHISKQFRNLEVHVRMLKVLE